MSSHTSKFYMFPPSNGDATPNPNQNNSQVIFSFQERLSYLSGTSLGGASGSTDEAPSPTSPSPLLDANEIGIRYNWSIPSSIIKQHSSQNNTNFCGILSPYFGPDEGTDPYSKFNLLFIPNISFHCNSFFDSSSIARGEGSIFLQIASCDIDAVKVALKLKITNGKSVRILEKNGVCQKPTNSLKDRFGFDSEFNWCQFELPSNGNVCIEINLVYTKLYDRPMKRLSEDFRELRKKPRFADVIIVTQSGKEFPVNKAILSTRSPVFSAMFSDASFAENQDNRVTIDDSSDDVVDAFLDYIYAGDTEMIDNLSIELISMADKVPCASFSISL